MRGVNQLQSNEIPMLRTRIYRLETALIQLITVLQYVEIPNSVGNPLESIQELLRESDAYKDIFNG